LVYTPSLGLSLLLDLLTKETLSFKRDFLLVDTELFHEFTAVAEGHRSNGEKLETLGRIDGPGLALKQRRQVRHLQSLLQLLVKIFNELTHVRLGRIYNFLGLFYRLPTELNKFAAKAEASSTLREKPLWSVGSWCLSLSSIFIEIFFVVM
jgi:hypothetical protein